MTENYIDKAADSSFTDLQEDGDFKRDLVSFFSGGRYKYSKEEMREKGFDGLTSEFIEHMRSQSWNEVTALRDLNYARNKDLPQKGKESFGRLTEAWDKSQSAGTGFLDGVGDFSEAVLTAPSTYIGAASFGVGKLASKAAGKATQLGVRKVLKDVLQKNIVKKGIHRQALKEAGVGVASGMTIGAVQAGAAGETRDVLIEDEAYDYTPKDLIYDAVVGGVAEGTMGGALGYVSGLAGRNRANKVTDILAERGKKFKVEAEESAKKAITTLENSTPEARQEAMKIVADLDDIFSARAGVKGAKLKDRLDPERVAKGKAILATMSDPKANPEFTSGLSTSTLRGVAAATVELMGTDGLNIRKGERITESVANALRDGDENVYEILKTVKDKYGLSKDEFSLIYMADLSRAGQTLGYASAIKRGGKIDMDKASPADILFAKGASSMSGEQVKEITAQAVRNKEFGAGRRFFLDLDAMRTAFMTSQPATTIRNVKNAGILVTTDMSDQVFTAIFRGLKGDTQGLRNIVPDMTAILRGYSVNKTEAEALKQIMMDEMPEEAVKLYNSAMRIDMSLEGNSVLAKAGRIANVANTLSDTVLKEGMFYGQLDRQFRRKGLSMADWLRSNTKLENVPEGISISDAVRETNRLTMQEDFKEADSVLASVTRSAINLNRKYPFLVSTGLGVPFPRYTGAHLQMVSDYAPLLGEALHRSGLTEGAADDATRFARQATGASMILGGYVLADQRNGEVDYGSIKSEAGSREDLKPMLGAALFHTYVGDQLWRRDNGLPHDLSGGNTEQFLANMKDVLGGIPDFSFDLGIGLAPVIALAQGGSAEGLDSFRKKLGDFAATFTMPLAPARDIVGQLNYDQAGAPFTRDLAEQTEVSMLGAGEGSEEMKNRALRMAPDLQSIQYLQSFNGKTDLSYYDFDNPGARGKIDPVLKQMTGTSAEPPLTELQKEMSRYNIKNWKVYKVDNPNVDFVVRQRLAKTMYREFENWKSNAPASQRYGDMTFDEITADDSISAKDKGDLLETWIRNRITVEKDRVDDMFNAWSAENPVKARGYIRNMYLIQKKKEGKDVFDLAAQKVSGMSADEYLNEAESVSEEIEKRMRILMTVPSLLENKPE